MLRMHKFSAYLTVAIVLAFQLPIQAQFGTTIYSDDFNGQSGTWNPITLSGNPGSIEVSNGSLKITTNGAGVYGVYYPTSFSGHFEAEIEFDKDHGIGLALFKDVGGKPSMADYSMLTVMTNADGFPVVQLTDMQKGVKDVLDNSNRVADDKFSHLLDGKRYSVPFTKTAKKLKIFRHSNQQLLHFYYAVEKEVDGKIYDDWMELSPSLEWGEVNGKYFVGIFSLEGTTSFNSIKVRQLPLKDQSDLNTGFAVVKRPYTWSGFTDTATVVTFGAACPFAAEDRKFVFWNLTNNIPVWHLNNGALMSHGFLETWDEPRVLGCIEPMSDRLLAFVDVEVIEDNDVRKVIKWTYELVNPDYKYPAFGVTTQRAEATEYYYIYADGSIMRRAEYEHTIHPSFTNWYEHTELIVVAGENQRPFDLFDTPSTIIHDLGRAPIEHTNRGEYNFVNGGQRLGAIALTARVNNAPELFYAFSDDPATPDTHTELHFNYEITWHKRNLSFGHWPVNKEPYLEDNYCVNWSQWRQHISHASFIGVSVRGNQSWTSSFLKRDDGTKYRQFLMLMGMNARKSETTVEDKTNSWLYPGDVMMVNDAASFIGYSHRDKYFEFEVKKRLPTCYFVATPKTKLVNPILRIKGWGNHQIFVKVDGAPIEKSKYVMSVDSNGDLLLLILGTYSKKVSIEVTSLPITNIQSPAAKPHISIYPNPSNDNIINIIFDTIKKVELVVFSIRGEEILRKSFESDRYQLRTENLPAGSYLLRINSGDSVTTKKIMVR